MSFSNSSLLMDSGSFLKFSSSSATFLDTLIKSRTAFLIVVGVIPCASLYSCWMARRRSVSPIAFFMESVILSAYMITRPSLLRAARPIVWIKDVSDRRKPSLSASKIATNVISGISKPSRKRLIPTKTSNTPRRKSRIISARSNVSISECRYFTRMPSSFM